jgi:hypothetical protein
MYDFTSEECKDIQFTYRYCTGNKSLAVNSGFLITEHQSGNYSAKTKTFQKPMAECAVRTELMKKPYLM